MQNTCRFFLRNSEEKIILSYCIYIKSLGQSWKSLLFFIVFCSDCISPLWGTQVLDIQNLYYTTFIMLDPHSHAVAVIKGIRVRLTNIHFIIFSSATHMAQWPKCLIKGWVWFIRDQSLVQAWRARPDPHPVWALGRPPWSQLSCERLTLERLFAIKVLKVTTSTQPGDVCSSHALLFVRCFSIYLSPLSAAGVSYWAKRALHVQFILPVSPSSSSPPPSLPPSRLSSPLLPS